MTDSDRDARLEEALTDIESRLANLAGVARYYRRTLLGEEVEEPAGVAAIRARYQEDGSACLHGGMGRLAQLWFNRCMEERAELLGYIDRLLGKSADKLPSELAVAARRVVHLADDAGGGYDARCPPCGWSHHDDDEGAAQAALDEHTRACPSGL